MRTNRRLVLPLALLISGCATVAPRAAKTPASSHPGPASSAGPVTSSPAPHAPASTAPGNAPFYDVLGERYRVLGDSEGYVERGVASWYGSDFHGKRTSSGEPYDMNGFSAAHKTLPLPTTARVTNLSNGKSIVVRINDRGPFKSNRLIDLSYAAARELDMIGPGTALVEVAALSDAGGGRADTAGSPAAPAPTMYVQVGAFAAVANAETLKHRLEQRGFRNVVIRYDARGPTALYRVRVGPIADAGEYDAVVSRVTALDIRSPQLVLEPRIPAWNAPTADGPAMPGG